MRDPSRRRFLAGSAVLPLAAAVTADAAASVAGDLERYIGFGSKQSGGPGDAACGEWLAGELARAGYAVERQHFSAPYFEPGRTDLICGTAKAAVWPQPVVRPTGPDGLTAPLVRVDGSGRADASLKGAIALVDLNFGRWSSALAKPVRRPIEAAFAGGARAAVVVTNGPSGKVIALNTDGREPMFSGPVALLAPEDAGPFLAAAMAGAPATLTLAGKGGRRDAFNFIGRMDRGAKDWLVVSTPRSGWFTCAGERGGGIAAWLTIARWAAETVKDRNLAFLCNSGHEYEYLGAGEALRHLAPGPEQTHFWLHLGANVASTDWHDILGRVRALPSCDSQRFLVVSKPLLEPARDLFAGQAGLEAPYASDEISAGELTAIIEAGYPLTAGVFGIHRYHHVADDDARCVSAAKVAAAAEAFRRLTERALAM